MNFVAINLTALSMLILVETLVLKAILRESRWFARLLGGGPVARHTMEVTLGVQLPSFSLPAIASDKPLMDADVRGNFAVFLFIARADIASTSVGAFRSMVIGILTHAEECLYVVCEGNYEDALWINQHGSLETTFEGHVRVLSDEKSQLRTKLGIVSTPSCAIFDEDGSLKRVGHPVIGDSVEKQARHAA